MDRERLAQVVRDAYTSSAGHQTRSVNVHGRVFRYVFGSRRLGWLQCQTSPRAFWPRPLSLSLSLSLTHALSLLVAFHRVVPPSGTWPGLVLCHTTPQLLAECIIGQGRPVRSTGSPCATNSLIVVFPFFKTFPLLTTGWKSCPGKEQLSHCYDHLLCHHHLYQVPISITAVIYSCDGAQSALSLLF